MAKQKKEDYLFAAGYICSHVKNMMNWQDMTRLASCKDLVSVEAILQEFGYGEAKELVEEGDVEEFIRKEQNKLFNMVYDSLPIREELSLCLYPYDYHNVKVCLKSELLGVAPTESLLMSTGDIDWKKMVSLVRDRSYDFMPVNMKHAIMEATDLVSRGGDPQEIDIIMDKACYKDMIERAEELEEPFLIDLIKLQIDILNLKIFVRLRQMNKPWSFLKKVYLEGGNIASDFFVACYEEPYAQIAERLAPYGLKKPMAEGGPAIKETGDFCLFEKLCDNALMEYNKRAKYQPFGIEPIAGYWYGKEIEIDNLRIILAGIKIGTPLESIMERLREPYV